MTGGGRVWEKVQPSVLKEERPRGRRTGFCWDERKGQQGEHQALVNSRNSVAQRPGEGGVRPAGGVPRRPGQARASPGTLPKGSHV